MKEATLVFEYSKQNGRYSTIENSDLCNSVSRVYFRLRFDELDLINTTAKIREPIEYWYN